MREVDQELFDAVEQGSNFFKVKKNDSSDITSSDVAEKRLRKLVKYLDKEVAEMPSNTDRADKIFSEQDRRIDTINANYGLADKERAGDRGLFGLHGI